MSLFLGPIHYTMFSKIKFQENFSNYLVEEVNKKKENKEFELSVDLNVPKISSDKLEDVVDTSNIHGSLQSMIVNVEKRLAFVVDEILKQDIFSFDDILNFAYEYGKENTVQSDLSIEEVYQFISSNILNGMPCDRIEEFIDKSENYLRWRDRIDIHADYWNVLGRDSKLFYDIRTNIIKDMIISTNFEYFSYKGNKFDLRVA